GGRDLPHNRVVHLAENGCRVLQRLGNKVNAVEHLIQRVASKVLRLPGNVLSALPRLGRATLDAVPDAAASKTALHQRRETNPATPSSISRQERGPVSTSPQTLRHEHALTATHRHQLVITITHPRLPRQHTTTSKPRRQRHRRQRRSAKLLGKLVEVTNQRTVDNRIDNKPDRLLRLILDAIPRLADSILQRIEGLADLLRRSVKQRLHSVTEPSRHRVNDIVLDERPSIPQRIPQTIKPGLHRINHTRQNRPRRIPKPRHNRIDDVILDEVPR